MNQISAAESVLLKEMLGHNTIVGFITKSREENSHSYGWLL